MKEQLYLFVDKTGKCFELFQKMGDNECARSYNNLVGAWLRGGRKFIVGDMLALRDDLIIAGFRWGIDFYVKKIGEESADRINSKQSCKCSKRRI